MPNLNDLRDYLTKKAISFRQISEMQVVFELKFFSDDGKAHKIELEVHQKVDELQVKATNGRYPSLCPNRHINLDGWFCLGLKEELNELTIKEWIQYVKEFLNAQNQCEINGVWPRDIKEWAHGAGAIYQKKVEKFYIEFKQNSLGVSLDDLTVTEKINKYGKKFYHLFFNKKHILVGYENQVLNKRQPCLCRDNGIKKHRTIGKCPKKCAEIIFSVAVNDFLLKKAEKEFWESWNASEYNNCCGTMKNCELMK